jgi:hypothetical protein
LNSIYEFSQGPYGESLFRFRRLHGLEDLKKLFRDVDVSLTSPNQYPPYRMKSAEYGRKLKRLQLTRSLKLLSQGVHVSSWAVATYLATAMIINHDLATPVPAILEVGVGLTLSAVAYLKTLLKAKVLESELLNARERPRYFELTSLPDAHGAVQDLSYVRMSPGFVMDVGKLENVQVEFFFSTDEDGETVIDIMRWDTFKK